MSGRFLQTDPIGGSDDLDLYAYVGEDPTDKDDPTGDDGVDVKKRLDDDGLCHSGINCGGPQRGPVNKKEGIVSRTINAVKQDAQDHPILTAVNVGVGLATNPEDGEVGAAPTAVALEAGELKAAQVLANNLAGKGFEKELATKFEELGYDVERNVFKRTPFGSRFVDIELSKVVRFSAV